MYCRAIKEVSIAVNLAWINSQACRLSQNIYVITNLFITNKPEEPLPANHPFSFTGTFSINGFEALIWRWVDGKGRGHENAFWKGIGITLY